jgi:hypothetical protein
MLILGKIVVISYRLTAYFHLIRAKIRRATVHQLLKEAEGFKVLTKVITKSVTFWDTSPYRLCLPPDFMLVCCLAHTPTLKMKAVLSSTFVGYQRRYIPEHNTF